MNEKLESFDFFLLRIPSLSFKEVIELNNSSSIEELKDKLHCLYQSLDLQDAIYLASPELYHLAIKWLSDNATDSIETKLLTTLYKYALRMGTRPTPFGLFAGISLGSISHEPSSILLGSEHSIHKRLDMDYTNDIAIQIAQNSSIKENLSFHTNSSLYKAQNGYRFYECKNEADKRSYFLTSIKASFYIDIVIETAKAGVRYSDLIKRLNKENVPEDLAKTFIDSMISDQILVSELEPTVTGIEFQETLLNKLKTLDFDDIYLSKLDSLNRLCKQKESIFKTSESIQNSINELIPQQSRKNLLQVDLKINTIENKINKRVINIVSKELSEIAPLNQAKITGDLEEFKKRFFERYEEAEVPILEAIDADLGIGYGTSLRDFHTDNPLIKELNVNRYNTNTSENTSSYQKLLLDKYILSKEKGQKVVELTLNDIKGLNVNENIHYAFPSTLYAMGNLVTEDSALMDAGDFSFNLSAFGGPSAIPLMARFGHLEPRLALKLSECAAFEESDNLILAEIIHIPESRVGNILQRTRIRNYEIPCLGQTNTPINNQISLTDLMVSIKLGKVVLRSKKLGLEIRPRLSCAHNYQNGISIYRFLCDLQHQHNPFFLDWDWMNLSEQTFLPRITYKHIVLSRARWSLQSSLLTEFKQLQSAADQKQFLENYALPQQVMLAEGDNELLINFSNPLGIDILINKLKKGKVILYETLFSNTTSIVKDLKGQNYLNEVIIPLHSKEKPHSLLSKIEVVNPTIRRSFLLGSEWVFIKIYCGIKQTDKILTEHILPLVEYLQKEAIILKWFFIRYSDPENHIRVRFLLKDPLDLSFILSNLNKTLNPLVLTKAIYRIQYDTYNREIERYGTRTMELSETLFSIDSSAVINLLTSLGKESNTERWHLAAYGTDQLLSAFGLDLKEKLTLITSLRDSFFQEFNGDKKLNYQLNIGYREHIVSLEDFFEEQKLKEFKKQSISSVFNDRSKLLQEIYAQLYHILNKDPNIQQEIDLLLRSYCHMFINRIFYIDHRLQELVIYHYLMKYYNKCIARN